jgi:methylenetetrahydrofolate dehydrogenase (NAD+)
MASNKKPTEIPQIASESPSNTPELNSASLPEIATSKKIAVVAKEGPPTPPTCKVILAQTIAKPLLQEVTAGLAQLGRRPLLVGFLANDDPAAKAYAEYSAKTCREK